MEEIDARAPRWVFVVAAGVFGAAAAALVALTFVGDALGGLRDVLVLGIAGDQLAVGLVLTLLALFCVVSCLVVASGWSLLLAILLRTASFAAAAATALLLLLIGTGPPTPVYAGRCATGYVVQERSFLFLESGLIYAVDGFWGIRVGGVSSDDGYQPSADGAYSAALVDGRLVIDFGVFSKADRDGRIELPARTPACR